MAVGTVKWFDCKKGYGFLLDENGKDVFVHYSEIQGDGFRRLREGEQVECEITVSAKGLSALKVRRLAPPVDDRPAEETPQPAEE